jgi:DNA-binding transcriptional LysR family regulator
MDWNDLKYIIAIEEFGSLNAAANYLGVNHSTVYRRVQHLEKELGVSLVIASRQGYRLSEEGQQLLPYAKNMAIQADAIELKIGGKNPHLSGLIRITAPDTIATDSLPALMAKFQQQYPDIYFEVLEGSQELNLTRREADIALRGTAHPPEHLIGKKMEEVGWAIFAATEQAHRYKGKTFEQLCQQKWVAMNDGNASTAAIWLRKHVRQENITGSFNSITGCLGGCKGGMGLAYLPLNLDSMNSKSRDGSVSVVYTPEQVNKHGFWILMPKELKNSAKVSTFYRFLIENWASIDVFYSR